jgi:hypothetical protein
MKTSLCLDFFSQISYMILAMDLIFLHVAFNLTINHLPLSNVLAHLLNIHKLKYKINVIHMSNI